LSPRGSWGICALALPEVLTERPVVPPSYLSSAYQISTLGPVNALLENPFSLHSIVVFLDLSNTLVRALPYFYVFIVLAADTVLMLQEDA
jgi:hypothetical protein